MSPAGADILSEVAKAEEETKQYFNRLPQSYIVTHI